MQVRLTSLSVDLLHAETGDSSLVLYGSPGTLLCDLLADSLSVYSAVDLGPCELSGVLPLQEERLLLARDEAEDLAVHADIETSPTGVDLVARECVSTEARFIGVSSAFPNQILATVAIPSALRCGSVC